MQKKRTKVSNLDVVILCGGLGTRLRPLLKDKPKPLAIIGNRPFLDIIVEFFLKKGFKRYILCLGYKAANIKKYYRKSPFFSYLKFSEEKKPLGTGGAVKNAEKYIRSKNFFVVNGDSFCDVNVKGLVRSHLSRKNVLVSMVVSRADGRFDCGYLELDSDTGLITSFEEKSEPPRPRVRGFLSVTGGETPHRPAQRDWCWGKDRAKRYINAGIYVFNWEVLSFIPKEKNYSLEESLFPSLVKSKKIFGYPVRSKVIDVGTPERYRQALRYFN